MSSPESLRERAREHLPLKPMACHVLLSLAGEDLHGYAIMKRIEARTEGEIVLHPGALYRELKRFIEAGMIRELEHRPVPADEDDERRRYYTITELGRHVLAADAERMRRMVEWTEAVVPAPEGSSSSG